MPINKWRVVTFHPPPSITTWMLRTRPAWPVIWVKVIRTTRNWCRVMTPSWMKRTIRITSALIDFCLKLMPVEQDDIKQTSPIHKTGSLLFSAHVCWLICFIAHLMLKRAFQIEICLLCEVILKFSYFHKLLEVCLSDEQCFLLKGDKIVKMYWLPLLKNHRANFSQTFSYVSWVRGIQVYSDEESCSFSKIDGRKEVKIYCQPVLWIRNILLKNHVAKV